MRFVVCLLFAIASKSWAFLPLGISSATRWRMSSSRLKNTQQPQEFSGDLYQVLLRNVSSVNSHELFNAINDRFPIPCNVLKVLPNKNQLKSAFLVFDNVVQADKAVQALDGTVLNDVPMSAVKRVLKDSSGSGLFRPEQDCSVQIANINFAATMTNIRYMCDDLLGKNKVVNMRWGNPEFGCKEEAMEAVKVFENMSLLDRDLAAKILSDIPELSWKVKDGDELPAGEEKRSTRGFEDTGFTLSVRNLPHATQHKQFLRVLDEVIGENNYAGARLVFGHDGRCRGYGFVTFADNDARQRGLRLLRDIQVRERPLMVEFAKGGVDLRL